MLITEKGVRQMPVKLIARILLLISGLALLLPGVLAPILMVGLGPITLQMVIGALSVILALYLIVTKVP